MNQEKTLLEIIAPTVDEAIEKGLTQLAVSREMVEIEILDPGARGLFGIGSRQARVRLRILSQPAAQQEPQAETVLPVSAKKEPAPAPAPVAAQPVKETAPAGQPSQAQPVDEDNQTLELCRKVVNDLLERMKIQAKVSTQYIPDEDSRDQKTILINVQGNDLSILIGRRSETLNALQYIASLIVNKETGRMVPITIDIQGYRSRRERQLRQLARRMADQAIKSGRRQILEPMPANERRLLHMELRDHPDVITESVGDEPYRKVTIKLKKTFDASRKKSSEEEYETSD